MDERWARALRAKGINVGESSQHGSSDKTETGKFLESKIVAAKGKSDRQRRIPYLTPHHSKPPDIRTASVGRGIDPVAGLFRDEWARDGCSQWATPASRG